MKKYLYIVKASLSEFFIYRLNLFFEVTGIAIITFVLVILWQAIFRGNQSIGGYSLSQMITYIIGAGLINSFLNLQSRGDDINDDINQGYLSNFLVKPFCVPLYWFFRALARHGFSLVLGLIEFVIIFIFFRHYFIFPQSITTALFFILSLFLAFILNFILFYNFSIIAFWMDQTWGFRFILRVIYELAAGVLIPLSLFPNLWQNIFAFLPFKYLIYFPLEIYLQKLNPTQIITEFSICAIWIIFLTLTGALIWRRGLKYYSASGG